MHRNNLTEWLLLGLALFVLAALIVLALVGENRTIPAGLFVLFTLLCVFLLHLHQRRHRAIMARAAATEETLRGKNQELERFFMASLDLMCIADLQGRILRVNPEWENVSGYSMHELEGRDILDFVHPEDARQTRQAMTELGSQNRHQKALSFENRFQRKDGTHCWLEWRCQAMDQTVYAAARDISQSKHVEASLVQAEARYRTIFERAVTGIAFGDQNGNIITFNQSFQQLVEYPSDELSNMNFGQFTHPDDLSVELPYFQEIIAGDREDYRMEKRYLTKSGQIVWVDLAVTAIRDEQGQVANFVGLIADISRRKTVEADLVQARDAAEAASRMKSEFLATVSHEIRTPLNAVIGLAQLCLETRLDSRQRNYLRDIEHSSQMLLGIFNDILDFSSIEAGKIHLDQAPFSLHALLDHLTDHFTMIAREKELALTVHMEPDVPVMLLGDAARLRQALHNLLSNAVKFTEHGQVDLSVGRLAPLPDANPEMPGPTYVALCFTVRDTGIGINPDKHDMVLNAFAQADSTTTRKFGGIGLGLSITSRLAKMMHGGLEFTSVPGQGSTFVFTGRFHQVPEQLEIPAPQPSTEPDPGQTPAPTPARPLAPLHFSAELSRTQGAHVLLVEDDFICREVAMQKLHDAGFKVTTARDGEEALRAYQASLTSFSGDAAPADAKPAPPNQNTPVTPLDPFDVILMDVQMPNMDGLEAARAIRGLEAEGGKRQASSPVRHKGPLPPPGAVHRAQGQMGRENADQADEKVFPGQRVPIIAMTAGTTVKDRDNCLAAGMDDYLAKPLEDQQLYATLARWIPVPPMRQGQGLDTNPGAELLSSPLVSIADPAPETTDRPVPPATKERAANIPGINIPGVDIQAGLAQLGGNTALHASLLDELRQEAQAALDRLPRLETADDPSELLALAHRLKGAAGNMRAFRLQQGAAALESTLGQGGNGEEETRELRAALRELIASPPARAPEHLPAPEPSASFDPRTATRLIQDITALIQGGDLVDTEMLNRLDRALASGINHDARSDLRKHLLRFDYDQALHALRALQKAVDAARV